MASTLIREQPIWADCTMQLRGSQDDYEVKVIDPDLGIVYDEHFETYKEASRDWRLMVVIARNSEG